MANILGGPAGPDGSGGAFQNTVESDRAALWSALGGRQGVLRGFDASGVSGEMALDVAAGAALLSERDASGNTTERGYHVYADDTTRVLVDPPSAQSRVDALVAVFGDVEDGPLGDALDDVGPQLLCIAGTSGVTTPATDADLNAAVGRGGWCRLFDVPVDPGDTEVNEANVADVRTFPRILPAGKWYRNTAVSWVQNGFRTMTSMVEDFAYGDISYDPGTGLITIGVTGLYDCACVGGFDSSPSGDSFVRIFSGDGREVCRGQMAGATVKSGSSSSTTYLEAGDTLQLQLYPGGNNASNAVGVGRCFVSVACRQRL